MSIENPSETLEKIHEAAKKEFLKKGFAAASLRHIVKAAGVTTGAFYGYYSSKEKLFDALVEKQAAHVLRHIDGAIKAFQNLSGDEQTRKMKEVSGSETAYLTEYIFSNRDAFKLLILCAEGTKYDDFVHRLAVRETESSFAYMEAMRREGIPLKPVNNKLMHIIASGFYTAVFETIVHDMSMEDAKEYLQQLEHFYTAGWEELLGVKFGES